MHIRMGRNRKAKKRAKRRQRKGARHAQEEGEVCEGTHNELKAASGREKGMRKSERQQIMHD